MRKMRQSAAYRAPRLEIGKKGGLVLIAVLLLLLAAPCESSFCAFDAAPAASLLFPFVVYDYSDPYHRTTTLMSITNLSHESQVVRATLWTDFGMPVLNFNIVLTGYDVQTIDVGDILLHGRLPVTLSIGHRSGEGVSDGGPVSSLNSLSGDWLAGVLPRPEATDTLGARCSTSDPSYPGLYSAPIPRAVLDIFQQLLSASQVVTRSFSEDCEPPFAPGEVPYAALDSLFLTRDEHYPTWMYMTFDVVESCGRTLPDEGAYWIPGVEGGEARYDNVLTGDVLWLTGSGTSAAKAVHLEANRQLGSVVANTPDGRPISFYSRYSSRLGVPSDAREPLPTAWALRYSDAGSYRTRLRVWKGPTAFSNPIDLGIEYVDGSPVEFVASNCLAYTYYAWDDEENILTGTTFPNPPIPPVKIPNLMPMTTQEVPIENLSIPGESGWLLFVWPPSNYGQDGAPEAPDHFQTWMGMAFDALGAHATFVEGTPVGNANCYPDQILPKLGIDYDYLDGRRRCIEASPPERQ